MEYLVIANIETIRREFQYKVILDIDDELCLTNNFTLKCLVCGKLYLDMQNGAKYDRFVKIKDLKINKL